MTLRNVSIKNKITVLILIVSFIIVGTGFGFVMVNFKKNIKEDMLNNTMMNSKLIGQYCIGPLSFNKNEVAAELLSKLDTISYINSGMVYDENNMLFASYKRNDNISIAPELKDDKPGHKFEKHHLKVTQPIFYQGSRYGTVVLSASTSILQSKFEKQIYILLLGMFGLLAFVLILSYWLQQIISKPILKLEKFARKIAETGDYSLRIEKNSNDEIGNLYDAFNSLLDQILHRQEARDKAEKALKEAKEKAEESDRLKSAFLANVSHEIRTPLNAILGFSELLTLPDNNITSKERDEYISLIFNSGNNLLKLIDDIIDISKIESNQLKINEAPCNIKKAMEDLLLHFREVRKIREKGDVNMQIDDGSDDKQIIIKTDHYRFKQIFANLIDNALKFTEKGFIKFGYKIQDNGTVLFYVKDSGIGLRKEQTEWIFERFRKVEGNQKLYRGAGLGLTISKYLVEKLGGKIWVESSPNNGSIFFFTLPLKETTEDPVVRDYKPSINNYDWADKTFLIVEDEPANIHFLEEIFKITNAKTIVARNGIEAVKMFEKQTHIDAVVMDIKMPKMDGYKATQLIREMDENVPIISQTAYAFDEEIEKAKEVGMTDYIAKPVKPNKLLNILSKHIDN